MLFNSIDFAVFLAITFFIYWFILKNNIKLQNLFILFVSYVFYGWWDWRFLSLIAFSSVVDYSIGILLAKTENQFKRKCFLYASLATNLGLLGFFKYFNFFIESFVDAFSMFGVGLHVSSLYIILPVGISFYTFQTLSYTIDIYKRKIQPTEDFIAFMAFVSFFPQLVAGPIERASKLLPQFQIKRTFQYETAKDGIRQILWGLFKKIVIADNCATMVNEIFANHESLPASVLALGAVYFAFQIYGDFSGYSDIAIGTAKLFGFDLMRNFAYPYFSRDIAEFWRRWHISLSTWFRDYLYIPLGGSRGTKWMNVRNVLITFTVSGFWHGANWTFIVWGFLNGLYFLPLLLSNKNRKNMEIVGEGRLFPPVQELPKILITFLFTCFAWIFFRSPNIQFAYSYISSLFSVTIFQLPGQYVVFLPLIIVMVMIEWMQRDKLHPLQIDSLGRVPRFAIYNILVLSIIYLNLNNNNSFIYFQF